VYQRIKAVLGIAALAAACIVVPADPASAVAYNYLVGHPANPDNTSLCTGGYAVAGGSGVFATTAGHCSVLANGQGRVGARVWGTQEPYGTIIRNDRRGDFYTTNTFDGALIQLDPDDTAYQIVVDPIGGGRPGGDGRVRGYYANSGLSAGLAIGKMGRTTGWTEGVITAWQTVVYPNGWRDYLLCSTVLVRGGDSGGPVWLVDRNGVMAVGMVIAEIAGGMCFNPIQNVLNRFSAWLPTFTSKAGVGLDVTPGSAKVVTERTGPPIPVNPEPVPVVSY
jgi:hypothetical protein